MDNNYNNNQGSSDSFYSYSNSGNQNQNTSDQTNSSYQGNMNQNRMQSGDTNYGQNTGYQQNSGYQQSGGYQQNAYGQGNGFGANTNTGYQQHFYQASGNGFGANANNGKKVKKKKDKKPGGFGLKLVKCAALALVFGLVSGVVFEGVHLASGEIFKEETTASSDESGVLTQNSGESVKATPTSSTYVATDVSDIVDAAMPSIVAITNVSESEYQSFFGGRQTYESTSCGSGIIVSQDSDYLYIVTNNHVVDAANSLTVTFSDDSTVSADVKGTDPSTDLAVIRVALSSVESETMNNIKVATLGDSDELKLGEASIAIGNALGNGQSVTTGCISALNREVSVSDSYSGTNYTAELIQTDAAINPGNSGGALLNAAGEVIGINSVKYADTEVEGIGYAIPISTAMPIIEDLITKEKVDESDSAFLGVAGVDVTNDVSNTYNMPTGVYVAQVTVGSAAEQAGIKTGDIITKFDGKDVSSMDDLSMKMQYYKAGETVDVTVQRSSDGVYVEQVISVTLGKKN